MQPIARSAVESSANATAVKQTGPFMLTLCRLEKPVSIRQPRAEQLKPFRFFTSRSCQSDGSERLYLHMGYFANLGEAQKWLGFMRSAYPSAIATPTPEALLQQRNSGVPTVQPADLTDSQVIGILETRGNSSTQAGAADPSGASVKLLKPEDTTTRQALREAVTKGAPVAFAVQLHWSAQPIDVTRVATLDIFKAYTLYATESRREGRSCHFLRLGFFKDAISAKQVALYVRSKFASAAVVPVTEPERTEANEGQIRRSGPDDAFQQQLEDALDSDNQSLCAAANEAERGAPQRAAAPVRSTESSVSRAPEPAKEPDTGSEETLQQTLELLAASEIWSDPESFGDTGVRHLTVVVEKRGTKRS
jgi:hypothetical protein